MNNNISFFNFFWEDLTNPSYEWCLNIVQVMQYIFDNQGKILVHCHAGQGRTAIIIGAFLLFSGQAKNAIDAIHLTRKNRLKCFSKKYNQSFLKGWEIWLANLKSIFPTSKR